MQIWFTCFYCEKRQRWIIAEEGPNDPRVEMAETASQGVAVMIRDALNARRVYEMDRARAEEIAFGHR